MIDLTKICNRCQEVKPLVSDFYPHSGCKGGYRPECKACVLASQRKVRKTPRQRLEEKFYVTPGCWIWTAAQGRGGYGSFGFDGGVTRAHRAAYQIYVGPISEGLMVCHRCDNRQCVNPDHLFLGTATDNNRDRQRKGRTVMPDNRGERNGQSRLTDLQVQSLRNDTRTDDAIASELGVSPKHVRIIRRNEAWTHL